ncbi:unnamed protein product [Prunus armeniaca]
MLRDGSRMVKTLMICRLGRRSILSNSPSKRKADVNSSRNEAATSLAKDASPLRKKPMIPSAEKTQVRAAPLLSARFKHLVGADNKKIGSTRNIWDVSLKPPTDKLGDRDLLCEVVLLCSLAERQGDPRDEDRTGRLADPLNHRDLVVKSRAVKRGVVSLLLTPLEVRMAVAKNTGESSTWGKGSSATSAVDHKVDTSSPTGDVGVSDLLKMTFLLSPFACVKLVDHIHRAGGLDTFSTSFVKKNAKLANKLFAEQNRYEKKTFDLRAMIYELKSSLAEKDSKLNSSTTDLASRKDAYFRLEGKNADISLSYDKLMARLHVHHESTEKSKSEAVIDEYKLGYCTAQMRLLPSMQLKTEKLRCSALTCSLCKAPEKEVAEEDGVEEDAGMRWWQTSWSKQVELLKAWLIRWTPKRLQIRALLPTSQSRRRLLSSFCSMLPCLEYLVLFDHLLFVELGRLGNLLWKFQLFF